MKADKSKQPGNTPPGTPGSLRLYVLRLAAQTIGAGTILWLAVPLFRIYVTDPSKHVPGTRIFTMSLAAAALIQAAYWLGRKSRPALAFGHALLGHLVRFAGRLSFVAPLALFSLTFVSRPAGLDVPLSREAAILFGLFSMFCYSIELDVLGEALIRGAARPKK